MRNGSEPKARGAKRAGKKKAHPAGVREIARLTGYSPAHVCYARRGLRVSRPLRAKMRDLGLTFKPVEAE